MPKAYCPLCKCHLSVSETIALSAIAALVGVATVSLVSKVVGAPPVAAGFDEGPTVGIIGRPRDPGYPFQKQDIRASAYTRARRRKERAALIASRPPKSESRRRMEKRGYHGGPAYGGVTRRRRFFKQTQVEEHLKMLRRDLREARAQVRAEAKAARKARRDAPHLVEVEKPIKVGAFAVGDLPPQLASSEYDALDTRFAERRATWPW